MNISKLSDVVSSMAASGYKIFTRPFELNIVGIRSKDSIQNKFDDVFFIFYRNERNQLVFNIYPCTTDPGTYWLNYPMNPLGSAAIKKGQYIDAFKIGQHTGYTALIQNGDLQVYRDLDRDSDYDFLTAKVYTSKKSDRIDIHRAAPGSTENVNKWSAGCQVFKNSADFDAFLKLCKKQKDLYGNKFTYTLLDEREDFNKKKISIGAVAAIGLISIALLKA